MFTTATKKWKEKCSKIFSLPASDPRSYIFQSLMSFEGFTKQTTVTTWLCGDVGCLTNKIFPLTFLGSKDGKGKKLTFLAPIMCQAVYLLTATPIICGRYYSHFTGEEIQDQKGICPQSTNVMWQKSVFILRSVCFQNSMLFPLLREKLTEVQEELQKKQELIEDLQPDVNQNGRYL